jgi:hypothetical protein
MFVFKNKQRKEAEVTSCNLIVALMPRQEVETVKYVRDNSLVHISGKYKIEDVTSGKTRRIQFALTF